MPEPVVELGQRLGPQAVDPPLRVLADLDQPGLAEHPQVPGHSGTSDRQQRGQLADCGVSSAQSFQHCPAAAIRQRVQHGIHALNVTDLVRTRKGT
jgi:hypothetical protein